MKVPSMNMKQPFAAAIVAAGVAVATAAHAGNAPAWVDSKEYKVLVDPGRFASDPQTAANALLADLRTRLTQLAFDKTVDGSFSAGDADTLAYYDTPGSCVLDKHGYSLRIRQGDHDDAQFKFRHADEELSAFTDVSGAGKNKSGKLETDVGPASLVYSNSTSQDIASGGAPATVSQLIAQFPGASALAAYASQSLSAVAGISVRQQEYDGPSSDIGQSDADFTLTLWYVGSSATPALAELSYRVTADDDKYFTTPVLQRSQVLLQAIGSLSGWTLPGTSGKTAWLYDYKSSAYPNGFCN